MNVQFWHKGLWNFLIELLGKKVNTADLPNLIKSSFNYAIYSNVTASTITVTVSDFDSSKLYFWIKNGPTAIPTIDYSFDESTNILTITNPFVATDGGSMTGDTWVLIYQQ